MTTRRDLEWAEGRTVPIVEQGDGPTTIVLAHGAGAGQDHPFMTGIRERFAGAHRVVTFDYPYVAEERRAPDRMPTLVACHRAVVASVGADRLVLGGKSMGGRVASHLEASQANAYFFLGYPLVPIGKKEPRATSHLDGIAVPMLFVQGERDRLGPPDLLAPIVTGLARATMVVVPDADHSFKVPKRVGVTPDEMLDHLTEVVSGWLGAQAGGVS